MTYFPVLILLCSAFFVDSTTERAGAALFDITKGVLDLLPPLASLRSPSKRIDNANETETRSVLKRITNIFSNRGNESRYKVLRSDDLDRQKIMERLSDTLMPVIKPLRNITNLRNEDSDRSRIIERLSETLQPVMNPLKNITTIALQGISKLPLFSNRKVGS